MNDEKAVYKTSDLAQASYLKTIGIHFDGVEKVEGTENKMFFIFRSTDKTTQKKFTEGIAELMLDYWNEVPNVSARKMRDNLLALRGMVTKSYSNTN